MPELSGGECPQTSPPPRLCRWCLQTLPSDAFPRQDWHRCRACVRAYQRDWSRRRSARRRRQSVNQIAARLQNADSQREVEFILRAAFQQFGGPAGFVAAWKRHLDESPAGSRSALLAFAMIARLLEYIHATAPSVSTMTDDELASEVQGEVERLVFGHPEVLVSKLRTHGWEVTRADSHP